MNLPAVTNSTSLTRPSFDDLLRMADTLAQAGVVPNAYRRKPSDIVAVALAGMAFDWDPMTSLRNYHVIEGTATLRPEAMLGLVRRAGHSVQLRLEGEGDDRVAIAQGTRADNGDVHVERFTLDDAERAGLGGKKNWKQYPDKMLTWRAMSALCRVLFPDVVLGAGYVPEEIGQDVDATGTPVEPDPFADPVIPVAEAKRMVLDACDGDKDRARREWSLFHAGDDTIKQSDLDEFCQHLRDGGDIMPAVVVEDPVDTLYAPVVDEAPVGGILRPDSDTDEYSATQVLPGVGVE